ANMSFTTSYEDLVEGLLTVNMNMYARILTLAQGKRMKIQGKTGSPNSGGVLVNFTKNSGLYLGTGANFEMSNLLSFTNGSFDIGTIAFYRFRHTEATAVSSPQINITGGAASIVVMATDNIFNSGISISS